MVQNKIITCSQKSTIVYMEEGTEKPKCHNKTGGHVK